MPEPTNLKPLKPSAINQIVQSLWDIHEAADEQQMHWLLEDIQKATKAVQGITAAMSERKATEFFGKEKQQRETRQTEQPKKQQQSITDAMGGNGAQSAAVLRP